VRQKSAAPGAVLPAHMDSNHLGTPPGVLQRFQDFQGGNFPHQESQFTFKRCLDGLAVDPLDVFGARCANSTHFHGKLCILHALPAWVAISLKRDVIWEDSYLQRLLAADSQLPDLESLSVFYLEALGSLFHTNFYGMAFLQTVKSI